MPLAKRVANSAFVDGNFRRVLCVCAMLVAMKRGGFFAREYLVVTVHTCAVEVEGEFLAG